MLRLLKRGENKTKYFLSPRGEKKSPITAMCVNKVCLTSFNHSGLCVFSLGNMEERGERLVMSQQPIQSAAASGNRKRKWPTCCRNHSLFCKNILLGAEIVTPGLIIFGLSRPVEKQAFLISGA